MRTLPLFFVAVLQTWAVFAQPANLEGAKFTIDIAQSSRLAPFSLPLSADKPVSGTLRATGDADFPLSAIGDRLYGVLPANLAAGKHEFTVHEAKYKGEPSVVLTTKGDTIEVRNNNELITAFHYKKDDRKPYLWPLKGEGDASLTRDWPLSGVEGKTKDHPHHVSFWTAHGDINGADFWEYGERTGWQVVDKLSSGVGYAAGYIALENTWQDKDHKPVIAEERTYIFYNTPASGRLLDVNVKFTAKYGDAKFGDTKEGGIVAVRMNDDLRETGGTGKITTSEGAGEKAVWGKPAAWCDYSGTLEGIGARGLTVMNHPSSFRYPIHWHVRAYGLLGANAFGYSDFTEGKENGDYTLKNGESIEFKFRIYLHTGDVKAADAAGYFTDYATPPAAEWVK